MTLSKEHGLLLPLCPLVRHGIALVVQVEDAGGVLGVLQGHQPSLEDNAHAPLVVVAVTGPLGGAPPLRQKGLQAPWDLLVVGQEDMQRDGSLVLILGLQVGPLPTWPVVVFRYLSSSPAGFKRPSIWILGHSYVFCAAQRAKDRLGGKNLGFRGVEVSWRSIKGLRWTQVFSEVVNISRQSAGPTILVLVM